MKSSYITLIASFLIILIAILVVVGKKNSTPTSSVAYTGFAQCLKSSGATFYGAWWCPHCNDQKKMFGAAKKDLPYVECSNPDQSQNALCTDLGIKGYPTWRFADGSESAKVLSLQELAEKTRCQLPLETGTIPTAEIPEAKTPTI